MARTTSKQIQAIVLGKEDTYPLDLKMWVGTLGVVGNPPFYLTSDELRWFGEYILQARHQLSKRQQFYSLVL